MTIRRSRWGQPIGAGSRVLRVTELKRRSEPATSQTLVHPGALQGSPPVLRERCQVKLPRPRLAQPDQTSGHGGCPSGRSLGAETAKCEAADEVTLGVEGVVNRCVAGEEALG